MFIGFNGVFSIRVKIAHSIIVYITTKLTDMALFPCQPDITHSNYQHVDSIRLLANKMASVYVCVCVCVNFRGQMRY